MSSTSESRARQAAAEARESAAVAKTYANKASESEDFSNQAQISAEKAALSSESAADSAVRAEYAASNVVSGPVISFVFDDGLASAYDVAAPLFEMNNVSCGFAIFSTGINTQQPNGTVYLKGTQLLDLSRRGFEIICHAATGTVFNDSMPVSVGQAEVATCMSYLSDMGIYPKIFQSPSSVLTEKHISTIRGYFEYAFTVAPSAVPMRNQSAMRLWRYGIDNSTYPEIIEIIEDAVRKQSAVIFYAHDLVSGSDKYNNIQQAISYCSTNGIPILTPSEACSIASKTRNAPTKKINFRETVFNSVTGWVASNGNIAVGNTGTRDITVTALVPGDVRISQSCPIFATDNFTITFSTLLRSLDSVSVPGEIGIIFKDSGGTAVATESITIDPLTNLNQRHYASGQIPSNASTVEMYVKGFVSASGNRLLLRQPTLVKGTSVSPDMNHGTLNVQDFATMAIPAQTIAANASYNQLLLTDQADNGLFSISGNAIRPSRQARISISACVFSNAAASLTTTGGILQLLLGSLVVFRAAVTPGGAIIGSSFSTVVDVTGLSSLQLRVLINGNTLSVNAALSSISIQELKNWN